MTDKTATLIDHMYCPTDLSVTNHVAVKCGLSDHFPIIGVFNVKNCRSGYNMNSHTTITYRKFESINYDTLISDLIATPWNYTTDEGCPLSKALLCQPGPRQSGSDLHCIDAVFKWLLHVNRLSCSEPLCYILMYLQSSRVRTRGVGATV